MSPLARLGIALVALASLAPGLAQVSVELLLDQDQLLANETFRVAVRVSNFSGQKIRLGDDNDWLRFAVEAREGAAVSRLGDVPVIGEFELDSSEVATKRVDLSPYFDLSRPGGYLVAATVRIKEWGKEFSTKPKEFSVMTGTKVWERDFGVPGSAAAGGTPEVRKYALQRAVHLKRMKLYFRLTDAAESRVIRVFPLGPVLSFSDPECQIDRETRLHVLYQTSARAFNYSVIGPDGVLVLRQTHDYTDTRPTLRLDREGKVRVWGGVRRAHYEDFPPPEAPAPPNPAEASEASPTAEKPPPPNPPEKSDPPVKPGDPR